MCPKLKNKTKHKKVLKCRNEKVLFCLLSPLWIFKEEYLPFVEHLPRAKHCVRYFSYYLNPQNNLIKWMLLISFYREGLRLKDQINDKKSSKITLYIERTIPKLSFGVKPLSFCYAKRAFLGVPKEFCSISFPSHQRSLLTLVVLRFWFWKQSKCLKKICNF